MYRSLYKAFTKSFVQSLFGKGLNIELITLLGLLQRLVEVYKIDISHNIGNRIITVGIVNKFHLYTVLIFQTI